MRKLADEPQLNTVDQIKKKKPMLMAGSRMDAVESQRKKAAYESLDHHLAGRKKLSVDSLLPPINTASSQHSHEVYMSPSVMSKMLGDSPSQQYSVHSIKKILQQARSK